MRLVRVRMPSRSSQGLLAFGTTDDPEAAALQWRRNGQATEPKSYYNFLKKFQCNGMVNVAAQAPAANQRLSECCMTKINNVVEAYNARLAVLVTNKDGDVMA